MVVASGLCAGIGRKWDTVSVTVCDFILFHYFFMDLGVYVYTQDIESW